MPGDYEPLTRIAHDPQAFESFYRDHIELVSRFLARRVADPEVVADLTAEVFLAALDAVESYRPDRGSPPGWLLGVGRNVVAGEVRRRKRESRLLVKIAGRRLLDPNSLLRIEERVDAARELRRFYGALQSLPRRDRALLELVALDGLSVSEAATVLGIPAGRARVRLHRIRARVRTSVPAAGLELDEQPT